MYVSGLALSSGHTREFPTLSADLAEVIERWESLPTATRQTVLALIRKAK
jgi:hypothetical protein